MVEKEIINKLRKFSNSLIRSGIDVDRVILYGSYAKGKVREDSDIDVAVVSRDFGKDRTEEGMLLFRIAGEIDSRIEPIPLSIESYEKDTWVPLIYEIRKNGIDLPDAA